MKEDKMYMTVPIPAGEMSWWSKENNDNSLTQILSSLDNKLSSSEYTKLWQELMHSGRDLDQLYEDSRSGTFIFKDKYDEVKKTERLNEALKQIYYYALADKKKHEEDRDNYFKSDKDLAKMKEDFIEETQELALKNSKYIEYNQRFAARREQFVTHMLANVSKVHQENTRLIAAKERLTTELGGCKAQISGLKTEVQSLESAKSVLATNCESLEQKRNQLKKEAEWMLRQNAKLKDSNARLEQEISEIKSKVQMLTDERESQKAKEKELLRENRELISRCEQTRQVMESIKFQLTAVTTESEKQRVKLNEEMSVMKEEAVALQKRLEAARANNHRTILRNQQLREKLSGANHKVDTVTRDKLRTTLKEHRTRKSNVELASSQLGLISEIIELKNDFFCDQARIKEGGKLNRKLQRNVDVLRQKIQLMKENPSALDPLDGAEEFKKQTLRKYSHSARSISS